MRNFEERKAEIFRRSENRIKERKRNRSCVLMVCIPLCLLITVCSVAFLPEIGNKGMNNAAGENAPMYTGKNIVCAVQIESVSADTKHQYYDQQHYLLAEDMGQLYYSMESTLQGERGNEQHKQQDELTDENTEMKEDLILGGGGLLPCYKITFTMEDGTKVCYTLDGDTLTKGFGDQSITLTQDQCTQLLEEIELLMILEEEAK